MTERKQIGTPIPSPGPEPIILKDGDPGFWKMSEQCRRDLEEIENNIRMAPIRCRNFIVGYGK